MTAFRAAHPGVELQLAEVEPPEALAGLRAGDLDLAVVFAPAGAGDPEGLPAELVVAGPAAGGAVPRAPAGEPAPRAAGGARGRALGAADAGLRGDGRRGLCAAGFAPRTVFESDDYGAIQGFVAAGAGVALVPELALANRRDVVAARLAPRGPGATRASRAAAGRSAGRAGPRGAPAGGRPRAAARRQPGVRLSAPRDAGLP